ncbi:MAG TPA: restriction endonuclease subunit S [Corynebacterium amycolatum]|nr:restriction endonuclease subunit S [Corynebacterium amycolatum]
MKTVKLGYLVEFRNGQDAKKVESPEGEYPIIGSGGEFARATAYLHDGESILFGRKGTIDRPLHIDGRFWTVDTMYYTRIRPEAFGRYLYYWATTIPFNQVSTQTALPSMTSFTLSQLRVPLPDLPTQRRIADYLDRETAQIDAMAGALDGLVARLEERHSSLSRQHIETAREHYPFTQVKFVADITTGTGDTQDATETGYPFYVRSNTPVFSSDWEFEGDAVLTAGDGAGVGRVYHLATGRFRAHQRVYVIHNFRAITPKYFLHVFRALFPYSVLSGNAQTTVPSVRLHMISDLRIPLPPLDEQRRIADHLDAETAKIDAMIAKAGQLRALLDERRSALITATVTGQHPVPEEP